jgi:hypothetical protein
MSQKKRIQKLAAASGVVASYSGKDNTMYISGKDKKQVTSFIAKRNLEGKTDRPFSIKVG